MSAISRQRSASSGADLPVCLLVAGRRGEKAVAAHGEYRRWDRLSCERSSNVRRGKKADREVRPTVHRAISTFSSGKEVVALQFWPKLKADSLFIRAPFSRRTRRSPEAAARNGRAGGIRHSPVGQRAGR